MSSIKIKDEDWDKLTTKNRSDVVSSKRCYWTERQFRYSPTGRYAAFKLSRTKKGNHNLYFVDLFKKEIRRYIWINDPKFSDFELLLYWLTESEMMLFTESRHIQNQYLCRIDHLKGELHTIAKHIETIADWHMNTHNDVMRFFLGNQEFLLLTSGTSIYLKPYRINPNTETQQATMIAEFGNSLEISRNIIELCYSFGYRDRIFYFMRERESFRTFNLSQFFCINLSEKKIENGRISVEKEDTSIFTPNQISPGTFRSAKALTGWQDGKTAVLTETQPCDEKRPSTDLGDRFWIIDLEKKTIQERLVESTRLRRATVYKEDSIMLWYTPDRPKTPTKLKYKQILRTDIVPRLKSICSAKLLSQKEIEKNKVKSSNNNEYRIKPVFGFVEPGAATPLEVTRFAGAPKEDKLVIQFGPAPADAADATAAFNAIAATPAGTITIPLSATA